MGFELNSLNGNLSNAFSKNALAPCPLFHRDISDLCIAPNWREIPHYKDFVRLLGLNGDLALYDKILKYEKVPKTQLSLIDERCGTLQDIATSISGYQSSQGHDVSNANDLTSFIAAKVGYLQQIKHLFGSGVLVDDPRDPQVYDREAVRAHFETCNNQTYSAMILNNEVHYDVKTSRYWGEYWLEAVDPCHRPMEHLKAKWLADNHTGAGKTPFFMWLEDGNVSPYEKQIDFLSSDDREQSRVFIMNGTLFHKDKNGGYKPLSGNDFLFVILEDLTLLSGHGRKNRRHVSYSHGRPILGVGSFSAEDGIITNFRSDSGHYLPSVASGLQTLNILRGFGAVIRDHIGMAYFENFKEVRTTVGNFCDREKSGPNMMALSVNS